MSARPFSGSALVPPWATRLPTWAAARSEAVSATVTAPVRVRPVGFPAASSSGVLAVVVMSCRSGVETVLRFRVAGLRPVKPRPVEKVQPGSGRQGGSGVPAASLAAPTVSVRA